MPQVFRLGGYLVYFWINEGMPLEPVHVHVSEGKPSANGTKIWITKSGRAILAEGRQTIPPRKLRVIMDVIEARHDEIEALWLKKFGEIRYFC